MPSRAAAILLVMLFLATSCDRGDPVESVRGMPLESAGRRLVQLRTLTQLLPNRNTHVAVDRLGQIFWVQESENAQDVLFMIGDGGIPRATRLTTGNILQALEEAGDTAGGEGRGGGNIRDIATMGGGVYFYFYGHKGNVPKACLGQYLPQSARIRILADTAALEKASGMGRSMELARASLAASGETVYLWLRHSDASIFFSFDPRALPPAGPIELRVPFNDIIHEGRSLPLTRLECRLAPAPGGGVYLLDITSGLLWHVDRIGEATARLPIIGLPREMAAPTATADDRLLMFAPDSEKIGTELEILARQDLPKIQYPAVLEVIGTAINVLPREDFRAHAGFPVYTLHFGRLVPETLGSFVSYDSTSGALMRVRIVERE